MPGPTIRQLGFALGAEVTGIDLRAPLSPQDREVIYDAWLKHLVLVFPDQDLEPAELIAFSRNFGELDRHDSTPHYRDPEHPEILLVTNRPRDGKPSETRNTGRNWHSDLTYTRHPAKGALLLCKEKPPVGGDTMFANLYLAYETLSPKLRSFLEGLEAIHDVTLVKGIEKRDPAKVADMKRLNPPIAHPLTGRKVLFAGQRVRGFVGMTEEESAPILAFLNQHAASYEFTYRHRWSVGDIVMWDNRCTQHVALPDFDQTRTRHMIRCSLLGDPSGRVLEDEGAAQDKESLLQAIAAVS
jgi:taurine dioxygenase